MINPAMHLFPLSQYVYTAGCFNNLWQQLQLFVGK